MAANTVITKQERNDLFTRIRYRLGEPLVKVELTDDQLIALLQRSIEEYSEHVNNWLIEQQWSTVQGIPFNNFTDFTYFYMTKNMDFELEFARAYGKQTGLGTNSKWELKKDSIQLSRNTQIYTIPANREVNQVLWYSNYSDIDTGRFLALNQMTTGYNQFGYSSGGYPVYPIHHLYNIIAASQDVGLRKRLNEGDFTYRIVGGPNGTKQLFLYPVPGGRYDKPNLSWFDLFGDPDAIDIDNTRVWYYYYDTENTNANKCRNENSDIVLVPSDSPIDIIQWGRLNTPARSWVEKFLIAEAKENLANVRGKFGGQLVIPEANLTMDTSFLRSESIAEKQELRTELKERLGRMDYAKLMEKRAIITENLMKTLGGYPMGIYVG